MSKAKLFIMILFFQSGKVAGESSLALYLQKPPKEVVDSIEKNLMTESQLYKQTPSSFTSSMVQSMISSNLEVDLSGIIATYGGYYTYSNHEGFINFPLRHRQESKLYLIVTPSLKLQKIDVNTISFLLPGSKSQRAIAVYSYEKKVNSNDLSFWHVAKDDLPQEGVLPSVALILLSKTKNIHVAQGDFMTVDSPNLVLPNNIYILSNDSNRKSFIKFLDIGRYFEQISKKQDEPTEKVKQKLITNY